MVEAIISLVVVLALLYGVYLLISWIFSFIEIVPPVFQKIVYVIFAVFAFVIVLRFLVTFAGLLGMGKFL